MRPRLLPGVALGCALWVVGVSALAAALSAVGWWSPWVAWPVAVAVSGGCWAAVRRLPGVRMPVAASVALVAVVVAFTVWAGATHSEQVLPRRDAASNLQAAVSLATTHSRVVAVDPASVGGPGVLDLEGVTLGSPAFFEVGSSEQPAVQPQFVVGPAVVYGFGWWAGGAGVALVLPAVAMGLALLALGLLVARVAGAWAGVATAALTGILFPVLHTARATYSEPLAMLTLTAGLLALTLAAGGARSEEAESAAASPGRGARGFVGDAASQGSVVRRASVRSLVAHDGSARLGLVAGVLLGGTGLVRVDALREVVLLFPVLAVAAAFGALWVRPLLAGLTGSLLVAAAAGVGLSWQYLASIAGSLVPLVALGVLLGGGSWAALAGWRRGWRLPASVVARLPDVAAALVVLVGAYLASRPLWQTARQDPNDPGARYVAGMQSRQGLPVDGGRTYAEQTVAWLSWYVGPVALVVALVVLAVLVRRALRSVGEHRVEPWLPVLFVAAGSTLLTLLRPGITPDHPWADRRLLIALPLVVALVVVGLAWLVRPPGVSGAEGAEERERRTPDAGPGGEDARPVPGSVVGAEPREHRMPGPPWAGPVAAVVLGVLVVVPALLATWPHRSGGVERGSLAAVDTVCGGLRPGDIVLAVDSRAANEWPQVVRGMCGVPALSLTSRVRGDEALLAQTVSAVAAGVHEQGGRLVLLAADSGQALDALGVGPARRVVGTTVPEDEHVLERAPNGTDPLPIAVWLAPAP